jgi:hypothetical protein
VGLERMSCCSAQRPRQTLIRVPIVIVGICEPIWGMDGMKHEYTGMFGRSQSSFFDALDRKNCKLVNE